MKDILMPPKIVRVFSPARGDVQYRHLRGGRGSGKSMNAATMAALWGACEKLRVLCTRDLQDSIKESFHAELKNAIAEDVRLSSVYDVGVDYLRCISTGTEFIFKGLRHNIKSIKSMAQIDLTIVEEAEDVVEQSWIDLEPTVLRAPRSEIWVLWNPRTEGSPVDTRFVKNTMPNSIGAEVNYWDNPWFPPGLEKLRLNQQRTFDPETYAHIWEGKYLKMGKASVFSGKWRVEEFTPGSDWDGPYFGIDFGFAQDPTAAVKCWINGRRIFIEYESGGRGIELDETAPLFLRELPGIDTHVSRADNARPESISYLKRHGLPKITACEKGKGSVEDGIEHIKSFDEVVIHPRCTRVKDEFLLYSYKVDKYSGDVLPILVDANNHFIDAIRYALEPIMKRKRGGFFDF